MERIIAKFGENSNGIRETDENTGSAGREPSAEFPGSQSLATFACFERCIGYERTASTCGCDEGISSVSFNYSLTIIEHLV